MKRILVSRASLGLYIGLMLLGMGVYDARSVYADTLVQNLFNAYSPSVLSFDGIERMWIGGWAKESDVGSDIIYYSEFRDGEFTEPTRAFTYPGHLANDPSVIVNPENTRELLMFFTALKDEYATENEMTKRNWVAVARSRDGGKSWVSPQVIIGQENGLDARGAWSPSAVVVGDEIWVYYNTNAPGSPDIFRTRFTKNLRMIDTRAVTKNDQRIGGINVDVSKKDDIYTMLVGVSLQDIHRYESRDGLVWRESSELRNPIFSSAEGGSVITPTVTEERERKYIYFAAGPLVQNAHYRYSSIQRVPFPTAEKYTHRSTEYGDISITPSDPCQVTSDSETCPVVIRWHTKNKEYSVAQGIGPVWPGGANIDGPTRNSSGSIRTNLPVGNYAFSVSGYDGVSWGTPLKSITYTVAVAPQKSVEAPKKITAQCYPDAQHINLYWDAVRGAKKYYPRIAPVTKAVCDSVNWQWDSSNGGTCAANPWPEVHGTAVANFPVTPGTTYNTWVHAGDPVDWNKVVGTSVRCNVTTEKPAPALQAPAVPPAVSAPVTVTLPRGYFDSAKCTTLAGWAYDPDVSAEAVNIRVYEGTTLVASGVADRARADVNKVVRILGNHGFSIPLPESLKDGATHTLRVVAVDTTDPSREGELRGNGKTVTCGNAPQASVPQAPSSVPSAPNRPPHGYFDAASCSGGVSGWAYDPDDASASIEVRIKEGDVVHMSGVANRTRGDVNRIVGITGNHGFSFPLSESLKDNKSHELRAYGVDSAGTLIRELQLNPRTITCSTSAFFQSRSGQMASVLGSLVPPESPVVYVAAPDSLVVSTTSEVSFDMVFTQVLQRGDTGAEVLALQERLVGLGLLDAEPTGYFGSLTEEALKEYQTAYGVEAVGILGPRTRALFNNNP